MDFRVMHLRYFAADHFGHGTLLMGNKTAIRAEHFVRTTKPLVGISWRRPAAPQFHGALIELLNHTRGITGIDGYGSQVEDGSVACLALSQGFLRVLTLG